METFHIKCKVENIADRKKSAVIPKMSVDTGSELTWVSANTLEKLDIEREKKDLTFIMANGQKITRSVGFAIIRYDNFSPLMKLSLRKKAICFCSVREL